MFIGKFKLAAVLPVGFLMSLCILSGGCASIGPGVLERDRIEYSDAIAHSWEQQMLKNIVKMRYSESLFFLEVASVINQYTLEGTASAAIATGGDDSDVLGGSALYADRPTITYAPLRGKDFTRQMLTPIPPAALFFLARSGWPLDRMFELTVRKVNGVANTSMAGVDQLPDPEFAELMAIFRRLQESRSLDVRVDRRGSELEKYEIFLSFENIPKHLLDDARRAAEILGIESVDRTFLVTYGGVGSHPNEIAVLSRSVMEIMAEYASSISVPPEHIEAGITDVSYYDSPVGRDLKRPLHIFSSPEPPAGAYLAIQHRDGWYWIRDNDTYSKNAFSFLNILMQLTADAVTPQSPAMTLGAGS